MEAIHSFSPQSAQPYFTPRLVPNAPTQPARHPFDSVSVDHQVTLITVEGSATKRSLEVPGKVFMALHDANVNIKLISQSSAKGDICMVVPSGENAWKILDALRIALKQELEAGFVINISARNDVSLLTAAEMRAGELYTGNSLLDFLASCGITLLAAAQSFSGLGVSLVVETKAVSIWAKR